MADESQKTEQPTPKKQAKAREEGRFPSAREFVSAFQFLAFVLIASSSLPGWMNGVRQATAACFRAAFHAKLDAVDLMALLWHLSTPMLLPLAALGGSLMGAILLLNLLVTDFGISLAKFAPSFDKLNPASKLSQLPSQNMVAFLQGVVLIPLMFGVAWYLLKGQMAAILALPLMSLPGILSFTGVLLTDVLKKSAIALLLLGMVMLARDRAKFAKSMKMSKQEIRDESKENDGSPEVKAKIRKLQREMRRRNMMKDVATATAVITNPTHYAVAIKWEAGMGAPLVVAKGKNYLALRIRQRAIENQIPIVENPPLAQALYKSVEVGQEIPAALYKAVAEILAYIFRLMNKQGGRK